MIEDPKGLVRPTVLCETEVRPVTDRWITLIQGIRWELHAATLFLDDTEGVADDTYPLISAAILALRKAIEVEQTPDYSDIVDLDYIDLAETFYDERDLANVPHDDDELKAEGITT